jgi:hypothetical protein
VYLKRSKRLAILEVACAWEPLVLEREREKRGKYREFACDLATQLGEWRVTVHPLVVGDLGSVASLATELKASGVLDERETLVCVRNCQFEALCKSVQIVRRQLSKSE